MTEDNTPADLPNESRTTENLWLRVTTTLVRDIDITVPTGLSSTDLHDIATLADEHEMGVLEVDEWDYDCMDENGADASCRATRIDGKWCVESVYVEDWPGHAIGHLHGIVVQYSQLEKPIRFCVLPVMSEDELALALVYHLQTHLVVIGFFDRHVEVGVLDGDTAPNPSKCHQVLSFGALNNKLRVPRDGLVAPWGVTQFMHQCGIPLHSGSEEPLFDFASLTDSQPEGYDFVLKGQFRIAVDPNELSRR